MIFALADLHLDITKEKDMSIFGGNWKNYEEKIFDSWNDYITEDDLLLIPGDISWAMNIKEAILDLDRIEKQNGTKILLKGNHDYWWGSLKKLNDLNYKTIKFLQNNSFIYKNSLITGTRGWIGPNSKDFTSDDLKIYERELLRLELSLNHGLKNYKNIEEIIVIMHFPPFDKHNNPNGFEEIFKKYNVNKVIYGHIHGENARFMPTGDISGIEYFCVSGDLLDFKPKLITNN